MPEEIPPNLIEQKPADIPRNLKPYFLCFLVKGERWDDPEGAETLMPAQLAFLREQIEWRRYRIAGPVTGSGTGAGEIVGFSILEAADAEAALALAGQDPAVIAGRVAPRILPVILPSLDSLKVEFPTRPTTA